MLKGLVNRVWKLNRNFRHMVGRDIGFLLALFQDYSIIYSWCFCESFNCVLILLAATLKIVKIRL